MKVTVVPIVIGVFRTVTKDVVRGREELGIVGQAKTTQTTALLRSVSILRRFMET